MFIIFLALALILITLFVGGVIFLRLFYFTDEKAIESWAKENNFTVLKMEKKAFSESPFPNLSFDSDQKVYRITIKDNTDNIRQGWIRCHGLEKGLIMERVEFIRDNN